MKYSLLFFVTIFALVQSASAQQDHRLAGHWKGGVYKGTTLIGKFKMQFKHHNGGYSGTFNVQGHSFPFKEIQTTKDDSVFLYIVKGVNGPTHFKGVFKNDSLITGKMTQTVKSLQVSGTFQFKIKKFNPSKPHETHKPYNHKNIIIQKNNSIQIGGTLTWPKKQNTHQLVIMITGSGPENRNEEILGFKIFGQIADYLTRHGIATFRYDDRGVGVSTGNLSQSTLSMLDTDVKTIINYFSNKADHTFHTIALLGHSQGGIVAGKVAAEDSLVDKVILMSSPSMILYKVLNYQFKAIFGRFNLQPSEISETIHALDNVLKAVRDSENITQAKKHFHNQFADMVATLPDTTMHREKAKKILKEMGNVLIPQLTTPIFMSVMFYQPTKDLRELDVPVLALFGGKDGKVLVGKNLPLTAAALNSAGISYQINVFKNAPHSYVRNELGSQSDHHKYPFVEGFLPTITQWLKRTGTEK